MGQANNLSQANNKHIDKRIEYVVFGYIRIIQISIDQIIPLSIIELCIKFYLSTSKIIFIQSSEIYIAEFDENASIYYKTNIKKFSSQKYNVKQSGLCYVENIDLPKQLTMKLRNDDTLNHYNLYDVIFSVGGQSHSTNFDVFIIDPKQYYHKNENNLIDICHYELPKLPISIGGACSIYSKKYGLIQIGNINSFSRKESFHIFSFNDYKWIKIKKGMQKERSFLSAIMINDDQLFCCGGTKDKYLSDTDIYNFDTKKWIKLSNKTVEVCRAGLCIDKVVHKRIYAGGGKKVPFSAQSKVKTVEYYDLNKNKWIILPDSNGIHASYPILWIDNGNILYMASTFANCVERIDLRENKWNVVMGINTKIPFTNLFGINIAAKSLKSRLLSMNLM